MDDDIDFTWLFHPETQDLNQVDELSLSLPQALNTLGGCYCMLIDASTQSTYRQRGSQALTSPRYGKQDNSWAFAYIATSTQLAHRQESMLRG